MLNLEGLKTVKVNNMKTLPIVIAGIMGSAMVSSQVYAADYCTDAAVDGVVYKIVSTGVDMLVAAESTAKKQT